MISPSSILLVGFLPPANSRDSTDCGKQHRIRRPIKAQPSSRPGRGSLHTSEYDNEERSGTGKARAIVEAPLQSPSQDGDTKVTRFPPDRYRTATTHPTFIRKGLDLSLLVVPDFTEVGLFSEFFRTCALPTMAGRGDRDFLRSPWPFCDPAAGCLEIDEVVNDAESDAPPFAEPCPLNRNDWESTVGDIVPY